MTGPEHYREAEWLLGRAHHYTYGDGGDPVTGAALATEALAHATLAHAAAVRDGAIPNGQVLVPQCRTAESAHGRQCLKAESPAHPGEHEYGDAS